jgi:hypothetical protein
VLFRSWVVVVYKWVYGVVVMAWMHNKLSVSMFMGSLVCSHLSVTLMAASSALCIVCRPGFDLTSMLVMVLVCGFTTPAHMIELPWTCELSVYTNSCGFHFLMRGCVYIKSGSVGGQIGEDISEYAVVLSIVLAFSCNVYMFVVVLLFPLYCVRCALSVS